MIDKPVLLTKEGLDKLHEELEELRSSKRREVAERIQYARQFGDITENAEYEDAKNEQGMLEGRILTLEKMVRNAVLIEAQRTGAVRIGAELTVRDEFGDETYSLVGPAEVDVAVGRISVESPVAQALMGHGVGDTVDVTTPAGIRSLKIVAIR